MLATAWRTAVRTPRLLWPALFAGLAIGSGFGSALARLFGVDVAESAIERLTRPSAGTFGSVASLWVIARGNGVAATVGLLALGVLLLAILAFLVWWSVVATVAVVGAARYAADGTPIPTHHTRGAHRAFRAAFGILASTRILTAALLAGWGALLVRAAIRVSPGVDATAVVAFVVGAIALTALDAFVGLGVAGVAIDRLPFRTAVRDAASLLRDHRWVVGEWSLLLTVVHAIAILASAAIATLAALPFTFLGGLAVSLGHAALVRAAFLGGLGAVTLAVILTSAMTSMFLGVAWGLCYLRLTGSEEPPGPWIRRIGSPRVPEG